jgi:thymidine phosphorylase
LGSKAGERVIIKNIRSEEFKRKFSISILQIAYSDSIVMPGEIGIFNNLKKYKKESEVSIHSIEPPESFQIIRKKIGGEKLTATEVDKIIEDVVSGHLSEIELASFITGVNINGMDNDEMTALALAEVKTGQVFDFGPKVYDKHSTKAHI